MKIYICLLVGVMATAGASAQVQSRLTGQANFDYTTTFEAADTFGYQYSGGRGSDMKTGDYKYDTLVYALAGVLKERSTQTFYYPSQLLQEKITENYVGGQWQNYRRNAYYYNGQSANDSVLQEVWNPFNKVWQKDKRITYSYDAQNRLTEYREETWDNLTAYGPYRRIQYVYNASGLRRMTESFWDAGSSIWTGFQEHRYLYDGNGNTISDSMEVWDNTNAVWLHELQTQYTYIGGKLTTLVEKDWDPVNMIVVSDYLHKYAYNTQSLPEYDTLFFWDAGGSSYVKSRLYTNTYDGSGNLLVNEDQYMQNDTFRNFHRKEWTYNTYNQPLTYNAFLWDATGMAWEPLTGNDSRIHYHYQQYDPATVQQTAAVAAAISVYPNPASHMVYIKSDAPATVQVYSLAGALVKQWRADVVNGQYITAMPVYDIAPGQYIIRVRTSNKQMTQQLLIAH